MDRRVEAFRRGAARLTRAGTGRRYPATLRAMAVEYANAASAKGRSTAASAAELGVPAQTLTYWLAKASETPTLLPVRVVQREPTRAVDDEAATVRVMTPEGIVIAGLTTEQAVRVVRGLR